jgi:hypothetical protein
MLVKLLAEVESLLKRPGVGLDLTQRGVNTSLALLALQGLMAYLEGKKRQAYQDLFSAAEEIRSRLEA